MENACKNGRHMCLPKSTQTASACISGISCDTARALLGILDQFAIIETRCTNYTLETI
jgi:hypothetical protein